MNDSARADAPSQRGPAPNQPPHRGNLIIPLLATVLLFGWIAFLAFEVATEANPIIVARPQLLGSPIVVEGKLRLSPPEVQVDAVWKGNEGLKGQTLRLDNLGNQDSLIDGGNYFILVQDVVDGHARLSSVPAGPGLEPYAAEPRLYPDSVGVRKQIEKLLSESKEQEPKSP